jgi:hypothetical protein
VCAQKSRRREIEIVMYLKERNVH